jgi:hypothetical protein
VELFCINVMELSYKANEGPHGNNVKYKNSLRMGRWLK